MPSYSIAFTGTAYANGNYYLNDTSAANDFTGRLKQGHFVEGVPWTSVAYASQVALDTTPFVTYPRPDAEVSANAMHRWAHSSLDYIVECTQKSGARPYYSEIDTTNTNAALTAAATMTLVTPADTQLHPYYLFRIPAATIAGLSTLTDYAVYIKTKGQDGKELKTFWSFRKEAAELDHFFFVDKTNAGTADGKFLTPFTNLSQVGWLDSGGGLSSAGKILVIKEGDSQTTPYTKSANWNISTTNFPIGIQNVYGERPKVDLRALNVMYALSTGSDDFAMHGIEVINGIVGTGVGRGAFSNGFNNPFSRIHISDCIFDTVAAWDAGANNSSGLQLESNSARQHISYHNLTFKNFAGSTIINNGAPFIVSGVKYSSFDNISVTNIGTAIDSVAAVVVIKHAVTDTSITNVTAITGIYVGWNGGIISDDTSDTIYKMNNIEINHNNLYLQDSLKGITLPGTISLTQTDGPHYVFRNTLRGSGIRIGATNASQIDIKNNVTTSLNIFDDASQSTVSSKNTDRAVLADMNADGTLTAAYLTANGLERGEIGDEDA